MTIEIIEANLIDDGALWAIFIEIDNGVDGYLLPVTLAGSIAEGDLQAALEAKEAALFAKAQTKGMQPDELYTRLATKRVLKAFALVVLDEINILRGQHALAARTAAQLRTAVKAKL